MALGVGAASLLCLEGGGGGGVRGGRSDLAPGEAAGLKSGLDLQQSSSFFQRNLNPHCLFSTLQMPQLRKPLESHL